MDRKELKEYLSDKIILFVDDDMSICEAFDSLTNRYFRQVFVESNPTKAIEIYKNNNIDLVISDITMPDIDGFSLAKEFANVKSDLNIIFISGHNENEYLKQMEDFGGHYIIKPINHKLLFDKIIDIFKNHQNR